MSDKAQLQCQSEDLHGAVMRLGDRDQAVRLKAERVVKQAGAAAIELLICVLNKELTSYRKRSVRGWTGMLVWGLCSIILLPIVTWNLPLGAILGFGFLSLVVIVLLAAYIGDPSHLQKQTTAMLMGIRRFTRPWTADRYSECSASGSSECQGAHFAHKSSLARVGRRSDRRAASSDEARTSDVLLRSADSGETTEPSQLLRASRSTETDKQQ